MKNVIKHSKKGILMVTMFATLLSFAKDASFFTINNEAKRTALTLYNVKQGNLLSIKDNKGLILFKEYIEKSGTYNKGFDLTALPDGTYIFELDKDLEINTIPFTVTSDVVVFDKAKEKTIFKPLVRVENDMMYVTKLSLNENPLNVEIYFKRFGSDELELMHTEVLKNKKTIERVYKLTGLELGTYKLVLHSEGRKFVETVY